MSADVDVMRDALDDLGRARSLMALLRWAVSHRDPPTEEAWGGLYIVTCDAEGAVEAAEKTINRGVGRAAQQGARP